MMRSKASKLYCPPKTHPQLGKFRSSWSNTHRWPRAGRYFPSKSCQYRYIFW